MALSEKTVALAAKLLRLEKELKRRIEVETNGKYSACTQDYIHINTGYKYDPTHEMVKEDLGGTELLNMASDMYEHFKYTIGDVPCVTLLSHNPIGGWADAEKAEQEA